MRAGTRGVIGSLTIRPFTKYKDAHENFRAHAISICHKKASMDANGFLNLVPVDAVAQNAHEKVTSDNKKMTRLIIYAIIYCGTHDIALRGKKK